MKALILLTGIWGMATVLPALAEDLAHEARIPEGEQDLAQAAADDFRLQHWDNAAAKYKAIIAAHPDCLYAWSNLGVTRFQQGRLDLAADALSQAVKLNPNDAFCLTNLGIIYVQLGRYDEAVALLQKSVALHPNDPMSHNYLGGAYEKMGRRKEGEAEIEKARTLQHQQDGP